MAKPVAVALCKQAIHNRRAIKRAELRKAAGVEQLLARLAVVANPRVRSAAVLKWLRPFIKTRTVRTGIHGTPAEVAAAMTRAYRAAGIPVGAAGSGVSGSVGGASGGIPGNIARMIANGATYKTVEKNRLSLGRLAAALGGGTTLAGGAYTLAKRKGAGAPAAPVTQTPVPVTPTDAKRARIQQILQELASDPKLRASLAAAGIGGVGTAVLSGGTAGDRVLKGLLGAGVAGGTAYAAASAMPHVAPLLKKLRRSGQPADANGGAAE